MIIKQDDRDNILDTDDSYQRLQRLTTIIRDSNDAITLQDFAGNILAWNKGAEKMYGWSEKEALSMNIKSIVPYNKRDEEIELINKLRSGEQVNSFETKRYNKNGKILDIWLTATVLTDEDNKPQYIATTERDITHIKSTERQLRLSKDELLGRNKELIVLNEQKNKFLGIAAHDLRSHIITIIQATSLLQNMLEGRISKREQNLMNITKRAGDNMIGLVDELLDVSKIESGRLDLNLTTNDYQIFLRENIELMQIIASKKNIDIKIEYNGEVPVFKFDTERIKQVISNLLMNAIHYSPENSTIHIVVSRNNRYVTTNVIDYGPGIPECEISEIFKEFYKNSYHTDSFTKPTGLGLAIVKKIIETHGGTVGVKNDEGKGANFYFTLPV